MKKRNLKNTRKRRDSKERRHPYLTYIYEVCCRYIKNDFRRESPNKNRLKTIEIKRCKMKKLNIVLVYNKQEDKILMCKREKEPYKGKFNLVGGKVEQGENELHAAYRELEEETGITKSDIKLTHLMNFQYEMSDIELELYVGKLNKEKELVEELNKLYWIDKNENFFNDEKFAGEGNIGHMVKQVEIYKSKLFEV